MGGVSRGRCAVHDIALSDAGRCLLCNRKISTRAPSSEREEKNRVALLLAGITVVAILAAGFGLYSRFASGLLGARSGLQRGGEATQTSAPPAQEVTTRPGDSTPREGPLAVKNRSGRSGYFYFPKVKAAPIPVLVLFHGQGGAGAGIVPIFRTLADARGFAIVAPDSGFVPEAGSYTWYAKDKPNDTSPDTEHILASIHELITISGSVSPPVILSAGGWLAAGHSAGGSSAASLATDDPRFSHFGVLHGGVFPAGFGANLPDGWFSTGESDTMRTPDHVRMQARAAARVIGDTRTRLMIFPGGHDVSPAESTALIDFWRGRP